MHVLLAHNFYRSGQPSGENVVVMQELQALRAAGVEVSTYFPSSDSLDDQHVSAKLKLSVTAIRSSPAVAAFTSALDRPPEQRPDVVHLHNVVPLISPWVIRVAGRFGVPVVQTVHNYRLLCANGLLYRDGAICHDCLGRRVNWPAVVHGCYRGSHVQSAVMTAGALLHDQTYRSVRRYLAVSDFLAEKLVAEGFSPEQVSVKSNFVADPGPNRPRGRGFLFLGRLTEEKGVRLLMEAWASAGIDDVPLIISGTGPLENEVRAFSAGRPEVEFDPRLGVGPELLDRSEVLILPSRWYEGLPTTMLEAFSFGRPVLGSSLGQMGRELSSDLGWRFEPTVPDLARMLLLVRDEMRDGWEVRSAAARGRFEERYTEAAVMRRLLDVYAEVTSDGSAGHGRADA